MFQAQGSLAVDLTHHSTPGLKMVFAPKQAQGPLNVHCENNSTAQLAPHQYIYNLIIIIHSQFITLYINLLNYVCHLL